MSTDTARWIGPGLRAARIAKGHRAVKVAKGAGIARGTYYSMERGVTLPSVPVFLALLDLLDVTVAQLRELSEIEIQSVPEQVRRQALDVLAESV